MEEVRLKRLCLHTCLPCFGHVMGFSLSV